MFLKSNNKHTNTDHELDYNPKFLFYRRYIRYTNILQRVIKQQQPRFLEQRRQIRRMSTSVCRCLQWIISFKHKLDFQINADLEGWNGWEGKGTGVVVCLAKEGILF